MTELGRYVQVIDCEHKTAPAADDKHFGYSIGTRAVRHGRLDLSRAKPVSRQTYDAWTRRAIPRAGDLIFSREAPMGEVAAVPVDVPVCLGQRTVLLRGTTSALDEKFLLHFLMSPQTQQWIGDNAAGSTVLHLNVADVRRIPIPWVPALQEQRHIVAILEDRLSRLDAADTYLASASARIAGLVENLLSTELGRVDSERMPFESLLEVGLANGRSVPSREGGFPVLRLTALRDGRIDLAERKDGAWTKTEAERFLVQSGDFLISRGNGSLRLVGRGGLVNTEPDAIAFPDTLIRARPDAGRLLPEFLALVWNARPVRLQIEAAARTTAGIYKVNQRDLKAVTIPVPAVDDQRQIVRRIVAQQEAANRLGEALRASRHRAEALRRSLLAAAFSGHLTSVGAGADAE